MRIEIYKPNWHTVFRGIDNSKVFVNPEVVNLCKCLSMQHEVLLLSPSDLEETNNLRKGSPSQFSDRRILLNGRLYFKDNYEENEQVQREIDVVRSFFGGDGVPQFHFVTDLKIMQRNASAINNLDLKVVSQSPIVGNYGALERLFLFQNKQRPTPLQGRKGSLIYVGNERGGERNDLVEEYLLRNDVDINLFGNWKKNSVVNFSGFRGGLEFRKVPQTLSQYKYALTISDIEYRRLNFVTPRPYEHILSGCVNFIDVNYDREDLVPKHSFTIVSNGEELRDKIKYLESCPKRAQEIADAQFSEVEKRGYLKDECMLTKLNNVLRLE